MEIIAIIVFVIVPVLLILSYRKHTAPFNPIQTHSTPHNAIMDEPILDLSGAEIKTLIQEPSSAQENKQAAQSALQDLNTALEEYAEAYRMTESPRKCLLPNEPTPAQKTEAIQLREQLRKEGLPLPKFPITGMPEEKVRRICRLYKKLDNAGLPRPDFPIDGLTEKQVHAKIMRKYRKRQPTGYRDPIHKAAAYAAKHNEAMMKRASKRANKKDYPEHRKPFIIASLLCSVLLLLALADMPYDYYTLLRIAIAGYAGIFFFIHIFQDQKNENYHNWAVITAAIVCLLFNPIAPIHFSRETWAIFDIATAGILPAIATLGIKPSPRQPKEPHA